MFEVVAAVVVYVLAALPFVGLIGAVTPLVSADEWTRKMIERLSAAGQDWERGMQNPSASPTGEMKRAKGRYKSEMTKSLAEGRWDKAIDRLTDEDIAQAAIAAGGSKLVEGVRRREPKVLAAIRELHGLLSAHVTKIRGMKAETDADREARMIENLRGMREIGARLAGLAR